jgi:DNA-directed RNA polymerase specialized sigma24 family protein
MNRRRQFANPSLSLDYILLDETRAYPAQAVDARPGPEQACALAQTNELVQKGMDRLSPHLRLALRLRDIDNLTNREAALTAGVDTTAIRSRTARARKRMAAFLADKGLDAAQNEAPWMNGRFRNL